MSKGWIYGSESQSSWTQVIYKSKYSFQNPLRQTHRHKKVLSKYLGINELHIQSLHNRHTSETVCPSCGSDLLKRTVKQGARQGSQFLGCSSFPRCRYTKELESRSNWRIITIVVILFLVIIIVNKL